MLEATVGLISPSSLGGGQYTFSLFFENTGSAKHLRSGDTVVDKDGFKYTVDTWSGFPSDFSSGNTVTATFADTDQLPATSAGFDGTAYTEGQEDVNPVISVSGVLGSISLYSGQNFEYNLTASWNSSSANEAIIGDRVVDSTGKEFEITLLQVDKFNSPIKVSEVEKEGISPASGNATLYRSTSNFSFYQGKDLTLSALSKIRNRDNFIIDKALNASGGSGSDDNGDFITYTHTITLTEEQNKNVTIIPAPKDPTEVIVQISGAGFPSKGTDYDVLGSNFNWSGKDLDGVLESGDKVVFSYFS
jgi:hypothetical protein